MATVLVVDDEADIRLLHRVILQGAGHTILEAPHGAAALEKLNADHPDIVVTDFMMPIMNGGEFIDALRANPATAETPVILVSSSPRKAGNAGADAVFNKPAAIGDLIGTVARLTSTHREAS